MRISDWSSDVCSSDLPLAVLVLLDHGLAVGCATVVDETRGVAIDVGIDDIVFVQGKQEGMPIFGLLAVQRVDLVMSAQLAFVAHHPFALGDRVCRKNAVAVDRGFFCSYFSGHPSLPVVRWYLWA